MVARETVVLAGGCFWCTHAVFNRVRGVLHVVSCYANGPGPQPDYQAVCTGQTGYAEAVLVEFDPGVVSLHVLLDIFFATHDPTTLNRQGHDVGTQYRSGVYCTSDEQLAQVLSYVQGLKASQTWPDPVVTEVARLGLCWPAEDYHQDYYEHNPQQGYCRVVAAPKVGKLQHRFSDWATEPRQTGQ